MSRAVSLLERTVAAVAPADLAVAAETQRLLDGKTKPRRSLGRLEDLVCQLAAVRGIATPPLPEKAIVVMGADHGVVEEGVSAYPQEVTRQMLLNFAQGGAGINALARQVAASVIVVDMGIREPLPPTVGIRVARIGPGTANLARGPAMTRDQARAALEEGIRIAHEISVARVGLVGIGEMGIGNTTAASALAAVLTGSSPEEVTGRGTGIDEAGLSRKIAVVRQAIEVNRPDPADPLDVLGKLGGFEIAGLAGVTLGAAERRIPVVVDGFISGVAALVATRLAPHASDALIAAHRSAEPGHARVLEALGKTPLLELGLRLGEGTGAALAMGLVDAGLRVLHEMASFASAGVSDSGR